MKYEIKDDSTQVVYEITDPPVRSAKDHESLGGDTVLCHEDGMCYSIAWTPTECSRL